jgi:outer membrane protein OmpA-like peptidoglycan-associated protein
MRLAILILCALAASATADGGRKVVTDTSIEILDDIHFIGTTTQIAGSSFRMMDAVAATLKGNPEIKRMEVIAFGSDLAGPTLDQVALAQGRARAIVQALQLRGVAPQRLVARGSAHPPRPKNPSPMFLILERTN